MGYCNREGEIDDVEERDENCRREALKWMGVWLTRRSQTRQGTGTAHPFAPGGKRSAGLWVPVRRHICRWTPEDVFCDCFCALGA